MKAGSVAVCASLLAAVLNGGTVWVDCGLPDYGGHDGSTEALALKTIQEAVDAAAPGDTVKVKPGVYDEGSRADAISGGGNLARVLVTKKLRIESTGDAAVTHIVGAADPNGNDYGLGDASVRCVTVLKAAAGTVLKGFTVRDGRSRYDNNANQFSTHAGGVAAEQEKTAYVVDCVVSNCVATRGGAVRAAILIRSLLAYNRASNNGGSATRSCDLYSCVLAHNGRDINSASLAAVSDSRNVVNCTFFGNGDGAVYVEAGFATKVHNCVAILDGWNGKSLQVYSNVTKSPEFANVVYSKVNDKSPDGCKPIARDMTCVDQEPWAALISPFDGDCRPVAGGPCDGTGDPALTAPDWVPEEFRGLDFHGRPLVRRDGKADIGAVQGAAKPVGGVMFFEGSSTGGRTRYTVESIEKSVYFGESFYVRGGPRPKQLRLHVNDDIYGVKQIGSWNWYRHPSADGSLSMMVPPEGSLVTNQFALVGARRYVDAVNGSDAYDGTSPTVGANGVGPKKTLHGAVSTAPQWSVVKAAPGVYDEGTVAAGGWTNRVYINNDIILRGSGADVTFIKGHRDEDDPKGHGCGPTAVRCVYAENGSRICVSDFTLADGCVNGGAGVSLADPYKGGAFYMNGYGCHGQLIDCVITNCSGSRGGVVFGGWLQRCLVVGNTLIGDNVDKRGSESLRQVCLSSCVIRDNNANRGGYFTVANDTCLLVNNTFIGNGTHTGYGDIAQSAKAALNNVTIDKEIMQIIETGTSPGYGLCNYQNTSNRVVNGYAYAADLRLVDKARRDLRPYADSPLVGGGTVGDGKVVAANLTTAQWFALLAIDGFDGNPMCFIDGKPVAGAYQKPLPSVSVVAKLPGDISPVGGIPWEDGGAVTVTATGDGRRHLLGFSVDGELVPAAGKTFTYTMAPGFDRPTPVVISAVYDTNWYVDADRGNDTNDGWTPETAKKTLVEAMKGPVAGDTVHAAAGEYSEGTVADGFGSTTKCRVNVPTGVTLRGDDRDGTIIEGKRGTVNATSRGLGDDAVRGVYLNANAKICNLTVCNGYTKNGSDNAAPSWGAGVLGADRTKCFVEDCTIRDCAGSRSGGGHYVTFNRCRLLDNFGASTGAAGRACDFYNTYISGCDGNTRPMQDAKAFYNSVYVNDRISADSKRNLFEGNTVKIANSAILVPNCILTSNVGSLQNVVFVQGSGLAMANVPAVNVTTNSAEEIALDDNGCPRFGSVLIDAGDNSLLATIGDLDCDDSQRVYNGKIDIGCREHDWRGRYGDDLGAAVAEASPEVVEAEVAGARRVFLPSGEVAARWTCGAGVTGRINATVTGNGVLEVYVEGTDEPFHCWTAGSAETFKWRSGVETADLRFRYVPGENDDGGAYLNGLEVRGALLLIR